MSTSRMCGSLVVVAIQVLGCSGATPDDSDSPTGGTSPTNPPATPTPEPPTPDDRTAPPPPVESLAWFYTRSGDLGVGSSAAAGDFNGDGITDFAIGAPYANANADGVEAKGAIFFAYGPVTGGIEVTNLSDVRVGELEGQKLGTTVYAAGDLNADGYQDLVTGNSGWGYVLFGPILGTSPVSLGAALFQSSAEAPDLRGEMSGTGDFNGDGYQDLVLTGPGSERLYVLYGPIEPGEYDPSLIADVTIKDLEDTSLFGIEVGVGDYNGDGLADLAVGAPTHAEYDDGAVYVFYAPFPSYLDTDDADATIIGLPGSLNCDPGPLGECHIEGDYTGASVADGGDVNGDRINDIIFAAIPLYSQSHIHIFLGPVYGEYSVREADFSLTSASIFEPWNSVSLGGDANRDGLEDVVFSIAITKDGIKEIGGAVCYDLGLAARGMYEVGCRIVMSDGDFSFGNIAPAGDVSGDLIDDLLFGDRTVQWAADSNGVVVLIAGDPKTGIH